MLNISHYLEHEYTSNAPGIRGRYQVYDLDLYTKLTPMPTLYSFYKYFECKPVVLFTNPKLEWITMNIANNLAQLQYNNVECWILGVTQSFKSNTAFLYMFSCP